MALRHVGLIVGMLLSMLAGLTPTGAGEAGAGEEALAIIRSYNDRHIARTGVQHVNIDLLTGDAVTKSFRVVNVWSADEAGRLETLFLLDEPAGLRGTNYLLRERRDDPAGMNIFLHLPVGLKKVMALAPTQFDEGLLGSDFSYRDIRWLLPEDGFDYRLLGTETLDGREVAVIEARPVGANADAVMWTSGKFYISRDPWFLLGADYAFSETNGSRHLKTFRVNRMAKIEGEWIATEMTMSVDKARWSRITLRKVEFNVGNLEPDLFREENLPAVGARVRAGRGALADQAGP